MRFTAHNIKLSPEEFTIDKDEPLYSDLHRTKAIVSFLKNHFTIYENMPAPTVIDLGCLEGGDSVTLAREGFRVTGLEGKKLNFHKCVYVDKSLNMSNLNFVCGDARTFIKGRRFDVVMSMGMLYHLEWPVDHIRDMVKSANHIVLIKGHYANLKDWRYDSFIGRSMFWFLTRANKYIGHYPQFKFRLSRLSKNESYLGRWFLEHKRGTTVEEKARSLWSSLDNNRSFWIDKCDLMQAIKDAGCKTVFQLYLGDEHRDLEALNYGVFIGVK